MRTVIYLSAGHNPIEKGARFEGTYEYDLTPKWRDRVYDLLTEKGFKCNKVPTGSLTSKVNYINAKKDALVAIEFHFNSSVGNVKGSACMHYPYKDGKGPGKDLAVSILNQIQRANIFQPNRGPREGWYRSTGKMDYFIKSTNCPAVIAEPQFIQQLDDIHNNYELACQCMADGIAIFLNEYTK